MSIKGLSDVRRLPRLGHLRLGIKKVSAKSGKEYPCEVEYFVMDPKTGNKKWDEDIKEQFKGLYGEKPTSIPIMLPPAPIELFFAQNFKRYGSSAMLKCKGDNETAVTTKEFAKGLEKIGEDERGFWKVKCLGSECPYQKSKECSRMAALQVILPEIKGIGIFQINTGSYNSIVSINSAIDWLKGLTGRFSMIPVTLMRVPTDIQYEGKKSKHYILQIDTQSVSIGDIQKFALTKPVERALIPGPDESKDDLFYDKNGGKPALEPPVTESPATPGSDKESPKEPLKGGQEQDKSEPAGTSEPSLAKDYKKETGKRKVSKKSADSMYAEMVGLAEMNPKDPSDCKNLLMSYASSMSEAGCFKKLIEEHRDDLRTKYEALIDKLQFAIDKQTKEIIK